MHAGATSAVFFNMRSRLAAFLLLGRVRYQAMMSCIADLLRSKDCGGILAAGGSDGRTGAGRPRLSGRTPPRPALPPVAGTATRPPGIGDESSEGRQPTSA